MSRTKLPTMVIVDVPGLSKGPARIHCDGCHGRFAIQLSTLLLLQEKPEINRPPVICHGCLLTMTAPGGPLHNVTFEHLGVRDARARTSAYEKTRAHRAAA